MAEIKLEDWLPMSPLMGPPLPKWMGLKWPWYTPPGAGFRVSDLVISPAEVNPGQVVTISCKVTNIGAEAGSYTVKLGGDFMAEQSVTLQPGESKPLSFEVTPTVVKTYSVSVDGKTGTFKATAAPVASIRVENLVIEKPQVAFGEANALAATLTNYGGTAGEKTIIFSVDWEPKGQYQRQIIKVALAPGESKVVHSTFTPTVPYNTTPVATTYYVSVNGLTGSFKAVPGLAGPVAP